MNTITNYVKSKLKYDRAKSGLTIISILLATLLLTVLGLVGYDYIEQQKYRYQVIDGDFHGIYKDISMEQYEKLRVNEEVARIGTEWKKVIDLRDHTLIMIGYNAAHREMNNIRENINEGLTGFYPSDEYGVLIDESYVKFLGYKAEIGEKIRLKYKFGDGEEEKEFEDEFIISGLVSTKIQKERDKLLKQFFVGFSEKFINERFDSSSRFRRAFIKVTGEKELSVNQLESKMRAIGESTGVEDRNIQIHSSYLNSIKPDTETILSIVGLCLVIMITTSIVIYSIFYMSIKNKITEYGKLRAIGTTKRQIKRMILLEGMYLSGIAIPIGMACGGLIGFIIMIMTRRNLRVGYGTYPYNFSIMIIICCGLVSVITVIIALIKPMRMAANISPIQAIRYDESDYVSDKKRKGYEEMSINKLTRLNLLRYKKRTVLTLCSLIFGGILFIIIAVYVNSEDPQKGLEYMRDFSIYKVGDSPIEEELINMIENMEGVECSFIGKSLKAAFTHAEDNKSYELGSFYSDIREYEEDIVKGKLDMERLNRHNEIVISASIAEKEDLKIGDEIVLNLYDGEAIITKSFTIQAIGDFHYNEFMLPNEVLDQFIKTNINTSIDFNIDDAYYDDINKIVTDITDSTANLKLWRYKDYLKIRKSAVIATKVLGYSLAFIIGMISFINLINTIMTSIIARKKELAILQAIGLSVKQLKTMFYLEGIFYAVVSTMTILLLGNFIGYQILNVQIKKGASQYVYQFPFIENIILVVTIFLVQLVLIHAINKKFMNKSLIERIRFSD